MIRLKQRRLRKQRLLLKRRGSKLKLPSARLPRRLQLPRRPPKIVPHVSSRKQMKPRPKMLLKRPSRKQRKQGNKQKMLLRRPRMPERKKRPLFLQMVKAKPMVKKKRKETLQLIKPVPPKMKKRRSVKRPRLLEPKLMPRLKPSEQEKRS